jgi:hypothetical protein
LMKIGMEDDGSWFHQKLRIEASNLSIYRRRDGVYPRLAKPSGSFHPAERPSRTIQPASNVFYQEHSNYT